TGFAVGSNSLPPFPGVILRTTDGGSTWVRQDFEFSLDSVWFFDVSVGIVTGYNPSFGQVMLRTTDGGAFWDLVGPGGRSLSFVDANTGIVAATSTTGTVFRTDDGGVTWRRQDVGIDQWISGVSLVDANTAIAVGSASTIARTDDGGQTWTSQILE